MELDYTPKEGEKCFYALGDSTQFYECTIDRLIGTQGVIMKSDRIFEGIQYCSLSGSQKIRFKPYKSSRQLLVEKLAEDINDNKYSYHALSSSEVNSLAEHLYDLGYVKEG